MGACLFKQESQDPAAPAALAAPAVPAAPAAEPIRFVMPPTNHCPYNQYGEHQMNRYRMILRGIAQYQIQQLRRQNHNPAAREKFARLLRNDTDDAASMDIMEFHMDRSITENYHAGINPLIFLAPINGTQLHNKGNNINRDDRNFYVNHIIFSEHNRRSPLNEGRRWLDRRFEASIQNRPVLNDEAKQARRDGRPLIGTPPEMLNQHCIALPDCSEETMRPINEVLRGYGLQIVMLKRCSEVVYGQLPLYLDDETIQMEVIYLIEKCLLQILRMRSCTSHVNIYGMYFHPIRLFRYYDIVVAFEDHVMCPYYSYELARVPQLQNTLAWSFRSHPENHPDYQRMKENFRIFREKSRVYDIVLDAGSDGSIDILKSVMLERSKS